MGDSSFLSFTHKGHTKRTSWTLQSTACPCPMAIPQVRATVLKDMHVWSCLMLPTFSAQELRRSLGVNAAEGEGAWLSCSRQIAAPPKHYIMSTDLYVGQFARVVKVEEVGPPSWPQQYKVLRLGTSGKLEGTGIIYSDPTMANIAAFHEETLIHEAFGQLNLFEKNHGSEPES